MKIIDLFEQLRISETTKKFLSKWTEGSTQAVRYLNDVVKSELKNSVKDNTYTVYRGWKFHDEDDVADVFGSSHPNLKKGARVKVKLDTIHSWTKDRREAIKFANPKYDSFEQRWVDGPDLDELGYDVGDMLGIGILVTADIPKDLVLVDLENVDQRLLHYGGDEKEIISDKGEFTVEIINVEVSYHDHKDHDEIDDEDDDENWDEKRWAQHNKEAEDENESMNSMKDKVGSLLAKHDLVNTVKGLKRLLDLENREDVAIGVVMKYGHKYPEVKEYAVKNSSEYKKVYKHFNVKSIAIVVDNMSKIYK